MKLMAEHDISQADVEMADVAECKGSKAYNAQKPPIWVCQLSQVVGDAFGVAQFYNVVDWASGRFVFVGLDPELKLAEYTFTVLQRKCASARKAYYSKLRGKRANRIKKADLYALGWVYAVNRKVEAFGGKERPEMVERYLAEKRPGLGSYKPADPRKRIKGGPDHMYRGVLAGKQVDLHRGVGGRMNSGLIGSGHETKTSD